MSILIKGKDKPTSCIACMYSRASIRNVEWCVLTEKDLPCDCPIIEVPTPHGRLIDSDEFDERIRQAGGMCEEELTEDFKDGVQTVLAMLKTQTTIIPAEEGTK